MLRYWSSMLGFVPQPNLQAIALDLILPQHFCQRKQIIPELIQIVPS
ncbi:hypothetical protein [Nostoc sp.]